MINEYGGFQSKPEPSNKEVWYSYSISTAECNRTNSTISRYRNKIRLNAVNGTQALEFIKRSQLYINKSPKDEYYYVDASKRYRPDLLSFELYGTPELYWVILECNNLNTPLDMETTLTLRVPSLSSIINNRQVI